MGLLAMSFRGICMHLNSADVQLPPGVGHRVVSIDATAGVQSNQFCSFLPPHFTYLETTDPTIGNILAQAGLPPVPGGRFRMENAAITVANATGSLNVSIVAVPKLTDYAYDMELRPQFLETVIPWGADSFVDIANGSVVSHQFDEGGVYTTWTVETLGDPELVIALNSAAPLHVQIPSMAPVNGLSPLALSNSTSDANDKKYDFALHYLAAVGGIDGQVYQKPFPIDPSSRADEYGVDMSTSCSNSQYP
jgi:hypothetical protein